MMGFGRCGEWFSVNNWSVVPDLITFAKGVNSGYIPLGGVAISEKIAKTFETEYFPGGGTYYGHPLACASAVAAIEIMEKDNLISRAKFLGIEISNNQAKRWKENKLVGDVRGLGLFWVIELVKTKASREPFLNDSEEIKFLKAELLNEGISTLVLQNKIYFCPPLIIDDEELEFVSNKLDSILSIFEEKYYEY